MVAGRAAALCPHAAVATALYAFWPAGVAMASVVGTDMPAAALLARALALLVTLGPRRPVDAAVAFGAAMAFGAWVRAVALPLSALALRLLARARRDCGWRAAALTAIGVAVDAGRAVCPGGSCTGVRAGRSTSPTTTAASPRSSARTRTPEGLHARAQPDVQGRHGRQRARRAAPRDRLRPPIAMAREWTALRAALHARPRRALKADRLFDPEHPSPLLADLPARRSDRPPRRLVRRPPRRASNRSPTRSA